MKKQKPLWMSPECWKAEQKAAALHRAEAATTPKSGRKQPKQQPTISNGPLTFQPPVKSRAEITAEVTATRERKRIADQKAAEQAKWREQLNAEEAVLAPVRQANLDAYYKMSYAEQQAFGSNAKPHETMWPATEAWVRCGGMVVLWKKGDIVRWQTGTDARPLIRRRADGSWYDTYSNQEVRLRDSAVVWPSTVYSYPLHLPPIGGFGDTPLHLSPPKEST